MIVSGRIFAPYENYMTPEAYGVGETFAVAMERYARDTTLRLPFPAFLEDYSRIAIRRESGVFPLLDLLEYEVPCERRRAA